MTAIQTIYNMTCAGIPLPLLVLYFLWYSLLGWCMETTFCSISERRFVFRGFLKGPICPIYGFGVMVMVLWLQQFTQNFFLFYLIATVTMSVWEIFRGLAAGSDHPHEILGLLPPAVQPERPHLPRATACTGASPPTPLSFGSTQPRSGSLPTCLPWLRPFWPAVCWL